LLGQFADASSLSNNYTTLITIIMGQYREIRP